MEREGWRLEKGLDKGLFRNFDFPSFNNTTDNVSNTKTISFDSAVEKEKAKECIRNFSSATSKKAKSSFSFSKSPLLSASTGTLWYALCHLVISPFNPSHVISKRVKEGKILKHLWGKWVWFKYET